ncbi:hypothetical protein [Curtobacterium sp. 9128]|uniref:hypothetical protein n=1 Tax=Curtobacterium sp. 9128 TaxID=1793722 RepID=UPI00119E4136|nr:hypothetical protein [Curtobacterium sp. 9128]
MTPTGTAAATDATTDAATPTGTVAVRGTPTIWHTLTASTEGWAAGTTFTYEWVFTDRSGSTDVAGATTATYVIDPQDVDGTVQVRVTGTTPGATPTTVTSTATAPVADDPSTGFHSLGYRNVDTRAGEFFSVSLAAFAGDGLAYFVNDQPGGSADDGVLPDGVSFSADGTLSGTPTEVTQTEFWVHVSTARHPGGGDAMRVVFSTDAGPVVALRAQAFATGAGTPRGVWQIAADGSTRYSEDFENWTGDPATPFRVPQTAEVFLGLSGTDAFGNDVLLEDGVQWTSSVTGDRFDRLNSAAAALTFAHASEHVVTATYGSRSVSVTIDVTPTAATTVVATTPTSGTTTSGTTTGTAPTAARQLAWTGTDTTGPIAWAFGLLAAGGALLVHRARRRRV